MSVLQSPGVPNSLVAGKNAGNFGKCNSLRENFPCDRAGNFLRVQGISSAFWTGAGNLGKIDPRFGALPRHIIPANTRKDAPTLLASDPRAARTAPPLTSQPHRIPAGWIPEDGRGRVRKRRGGESRSFILARRAGGRPGRSWCRAPATDHPHPRGDPRRSRLGRRRGSLCLLRAPGRSQRRPCGRSSP